MRNVKTIKEELEQKVVRAFLDSGMALQKSECIWLAKVAADIFSEGLVELATAIPKISEDPMRLHAYNGKSITGRHIVDGKVRRITQIFNDSGTVYYTDAKREVIK